jgi:hypothetical protein
VSAPGRSCPLHYRYPAEVFRNLPALSTDTLYVAGGVYGNRAALDRLLALVEPRAALVFNGDFHWFDVDDDDFTAISEAALSHAALRGNVETELAGGDADAGCGCAYPASVSDAEVERSNRILLRLRETARRHEALTARLAALPMQRVAEVGPLRIGLVHGDAESLAGWGFAHDQLQAGADADRQLAALFSRAGVDVFASSHTCLPALHEVDTADGRRAVINNGATGMPNFRGTRFGVATRISLSPAPPALRLYGTRLRGVHVDAIRIDYDHDRFLRRFLSDWPQGSDAHRSYFGRIIEGPDFTPAAALGEHGQPDHRRMPVE